jgi:hypothetical protein
MDTLTEQHGRTAQRRKTAEYEMCLDDLIGAVESDVEYNTLRQLVHRSGAGWICASSSCRGINASSDGRCCGCNKLRPKVRDIPVPESSIGSTVRHSRSEFET